MVSSESTLSQPDSCQACEVPRGGGRRRRRHRPRTRFRVTSRHLAGTPGGFSVESGPSERLPSWVPRHSLQNAHCVHSYRFRSGQRRVCCSSSPEQLASDFPEPTAHNASSACRRLSWRLTRRDDQTLPNNALTRVRTLERFVSATRP